MHRPRLVPRRRRLQLTALIVIAALGAGIGPVTAAGGGTKTSQPAMLTAVGAGITVTPLITVGETAGDDGYVFESVPDGIARQGPQQRDRRRLRQPRDLARPVPVHAIGADRAQLPERLRQRPGQQTGAAPEERRGAERRDGHHQRRQLPALLLELSRDGREGFDREILFTNEESVDWVNRSGNAWPAVIGADAARQSGVVVAYDVKSGTNRPIWGMGRHNHENSVPIPGFDDLVLLSGDDTFTNNPSQSQLYSYIAPDADAVWNDQGALWAFQTNGAKQKYEDFVPGDATSVTGQFIQVPRLIATGRNPDGTDLMAGDVPASFGGPYPLPPNDPTWQRDPNGVGIDGPQWVLDEWSRRHDVFGSSASRTSPTTSGLACPMLRTSSTPAAAPRRPSRCRLHHPFRSSGQGSRRTVASGRWSSIPTTRPR